MTLAQRYNDLARRLTQGWALPRRIVLSFAPSAAAGLHFDSVKATYGNKAERRSSFFIALYPERHGATSWFCFVATLTHTHKLNLSRSCLRLTLRRIRVRLFFVKTLTPTYKLNLSRRCLRLTLRRIQLRLFFIFCRNVNTYIQTQPKHKLFEVDFKADSSAIVLCFLSQR